MEGGKEEQIDSSTKKDDHVDDIYIPKPSYAYGDLFQGIDDYITEKGTPPAIHELDFLKGDMI